MNDRCPEVRPAVLDPDDIRCAKWGAPKLDIRTVEKGKAGLDRGCVKTRVREPS